MANGQSDKSKDVIRESLKDKTLLSVAEASLYFNIGQRTLREALKKEDCPYRFTVGNRLKVKRQELEDYIAENNCI